MKAKHAFGEIVSPLLDAADAQIDLRASSIEALEAFEYFRTELFEAKHEAA